VQEQAIWPYIVRQSAQLFKNSDPAVKGLVRKSGVQSLVKEMKLRLVRETCAIAGR
jgi:hypothetical protein